MEPTDVNPKDQVTKQINNSYQLNSSLLMELFENELKSIYWAEKALTSALPNMARNAADANVIEAFEQHLIETQGQVEKLEQVFELIKKPASEKRCEAMASLIKEGELIMLSTAYGPQRDVAIISAAQKVEHYEIASYGTLKTFAKTLGMEDVTIILGGILEEEKNADNNLTKIAISEINEEALNKS